MFNFLDPKLLPKVTCKSPATENYEPTNLISDNDLIRARGFLAYTVVQPPVELEFEFLCPVDISWICLQTTIGRQKCTGLELLAKKDTAPFISIGKAFYDEDGITFCNSKKYSKSKPPLHHNPMNNLVFFKSDKYHVFSDANFLKIVIFRTENRSVPCLSSVKVFGKPSRSCSKVTSDTISKLMDISSKLVPQNENFETRNEISIPEDFKDALTFEIMTIPMTLPSGKTVDRDTLEKHIDNEKSFGRKACDPFTGLKFTDTRKPIINASLKSRIDMFLVQNSNNPFTYGLKRTLGSDENSSKRSKNECIESYKCCKCEGRERLYVIPCQHYYCRDCLISLENWKCNSCQKEFSRSNARRCHH